MHRYTFGVPPGGSPRGRSAWSFIAIYSVGSAIAWLEALGFTQSRDLSLAVIGVKNIAES